MTDPSKVFNYKEAAQQFGMAYSSFTRLIKRHKRRLSEFLKRERYNGRFSNLITAEGLAVLAGMKNIKNNLHRVNFSAKKEITTKAIAASKPSSQISTMSLEMMHKMLGEVIASQKDITNIKEQQESLNIRLSLVEGDTKNAPVTSGQKDRLNERIRLLAFKSKIPHGKLWNELHRKLGRDALSEYKFDDYQAAIRIMKSAFKQANIKW